MTRRADLREEATPKTRDSDWRAALRDAASTGSDLERAGLVAGGEAATVDAVRTVFQVRIPPSYRDALADTGRAEEATSGPYDPDDPLYRMAVPSVAELATRPEERRDPIGDRTHEVAPGLIHRYADRALLAPTHTCAIYCRYCFRREVVGTAEATPSRAELDEALAAIARTPALWEVILTGGDPLMLSDERLGDLLARLRAIEHVRVVRLHTRMPVVVPERVTDALLDHLSALGRPRKPAWVGLHVNHPREITAAAEEAISRLADRGVPLVNQSVLLRGVNDDAETLEALGRKLVELRVKPYYLHQADYARGTGHFRVPLEAGQALLRDLRGRVSGLAQPTYVLDVPGGFGKVPVGPTYARPADDPPGERWRVEDPDGGLHDYPPRPRGDGES